MHPSPLCDCQPEFASYPLSGSDRCLQFFATLFLSFPFLPKVFPIQMTALSCANGRIFLSFFVALWHDARRKQTCFSSCSSGCKYVRTLVILCGPPVSTPSFSTSLSKIEICGKKGGLAPFEKDPKHPAGVDDRYSFILPPHSGVYLCGQDNNALLPLTFFCSSQAPPIFCCDLRLLRYQMVRKKWREKEREGRSKGKMRCQIVSLG